MYRIDKDSLGEVNVPSDAYYGPFTVRASNQYNVTGQKSHINMIKAFIMIKTLCGSCKIKIWVY